MYSLPQNPKTPRSALFDLNSKMRHQDDQRTFATTADPFNWPAQNRADLMSLAVLNDHKDLMNTRTQNMRPRMRETSHNLHTDDIEGN